MKPRLLVLVALCLSACRALDASPPPLEPPIRVLLLGDSISMGYTSHVRSALAGRALVVRPTNAKGAPENCAGTTHGVQHIARWLELEGGAFDVIHFNFGLHDLKRVQPGSGQNSNDPAHPHQAPPERYSAQLRTIVQALEATGARLVYATTTPVPPGGVKPHREPSDVVLYNDIARVVMRAHGIPINDLYAFALARLDEIQQPVNVHFSGPGSHALASEVVAAIELAAGW